MRAGFVIGRHVGYLSLTNLSLSASYRDVRQVIIVLYRRFVSHVLSSMLITLCVCNLLAGEMFIVLFSLARLFTYDERSNKQF